MFSRLLLSLEQFQRSRLPSFFVVLVPSRVHTYGVVFVATGISLAVLTWYVPRDVTAVVDCCDRGVGPASEDGWYAVGRLKA